MKANPPVTYSSSADLGLAVKAWQGLRGDLVTPGSVLISGTGEDQAGVLYVGPMSGGGGFHSVQVPEAKTTSVYGPDSFANGQVRLVGSFTFEREVREVNHAFIWDGVLGDLPSGGSFRLIDYKGAQIQFAHSTMGNLVVGNAAGPDPDAPGVAWLYDALGRVFLPDIVYPGSKSTTAYGIWWNGGTSYTLCGGYSHLAQNPLMRTRMPLAEGSGFLVDYDAATQRFSHWTSFAYPNGKDGVDYVTHFEGISSVEQGVYTLAADSVQAVDAAQASWVRVKRLPDGTFDAGVWVDLTYPPPPKGVDGITSANSVFDNMVVGVVIGGDLAYQATIEGV